MKRTLIAGAMSLVCSGAFALGYPTPQPKPCKVYWDSAKSHKTVAEHPDVVSYLADQHFVLARLKDGNGLMLTHDPKGCHVGYIIPALILRTYYPWLVKGWGV